MRLGPDLGEISGADMGLPEAGEDNESVSTTCGPLR